MKTSILFFMFMFFQTGILPAQSKNLSQPEGIQLWKKIEAVNQAGRRNLSKHTQTQLKSLDSIYFNQFNSPVIFKFDYDAQGNETLLETIFTDNGAISYGERFELTYNPQNLVTEILEKRYDSNSQTWELNKKNLVTYNVQNQIEEIMVYDYDDVNANWDEETKYIFQYNTDNLLDNYIKQIYNNGNWEDHFKREITYTASGEYSVIKDYEWENAQWNAIRETDFQYDAAGLLTSYTELRGNNTLNPFMKKTFSYDSDMNLLQETTYDWDYTTASWVGDLQMDFSYDGFQSISEIIYQQYDTTASTWDLWNKEVYTYDHNYTYDELLLPYFLFSWDEDVFAEYDVWDFELDHVFKYKLNLVEAYDRENNAWNFSHTVEFYYGDIVSAVSQNELLQEVYLAPNPAASQVKILNTAGLHQATIDIYDASSQLIYSGEVDRPVDVSSFSKGIYFYRITAREGLQTGRLLIK